MDESAMVSRYARRASVLNRLLFLGLLTYAVPVQAAGSASGATLTDADAVFCAEHGALFDNGGNTWTLSGGVVYENGQKAGYSANVIELAYVNGLIYQENSAGGWWNWNGGGWLYTQSPFGGGTNNITASFFGMHMGAATLEPWPTVSFGAARTLGSWPGIAWADINTSSGVYNWGQLDALVAIYQAHGVDIVYTFGYSPEWTAQPSAANLTNWENFVTAIVARYGTKIKYWELWNEPNAPNFWTGSTADMVAMASAAYPIIHNADGVVLSPAPQGTNAYQWLQDYFSAGGKNYTDVVAFHGYLDDAPEKIIPLIKNVQTVAAANGLSGKPIWDTEHSWGTLTWPYGDSYANQSNWLARFIMLEASAGVQRSYWYMWDTIGPDYWGDLFMRSTHTILPPGTAYQMVHDWLIGKSIQCSVSGVLYKCTITSATTQEVYWTTSGTQGVTVSTQYTQQQSITGTTSGIANHSIVASGTPLLVE
jgi:polysaccharide biosynthesis protein PslG